MSQVRVICMEKKRVKPRMMQLFLNNAMFKLVRAIGIGERRGPAWPAGPHHVTLTMVFGKHGVCA
jgi:hypothetical protein